MADPVTEVKAAVAADQAKVQGFVAKQVAWVKANPVKVTAAAAALVAAVFKFHKFL